MRIRPGEHTGAVLSPSHWCLQCSGLQGQQPISAWTTLVERKRPSGFAPISGAWRPAAARTGQQHSRCDACQAVAPHGTWGSVPAPCHARAPAQSPAHPGWPDSGP